MSEEKRAHKGEIFSARCLLECAREKTAYVEIYDEDPKIRELSQQAKLSVITALARISEIEAHINQEEKKQ